jgi:hypothetical protein
LHTSFGISGLAAVLIQITAPSYAGVIKTKNTDFLLAYNEQLMAIADIGCHIR